MKLAAFVPIKLNNERFPNKNLKMLDDTPLVTRIFETLLRVDEIDALHCFCSSEEVGSYLPKSVKLTIRPQWLDLNSTSIIDVCKNFALTIEADYYLCAHATAPFISPDSIRKGVEIVLSGKHDSSLSVTENREFLWSHVNDSESLVPNYNLDNIPRTQDIKPFYIETSGFWVYKREHILNERRRVGHNPYFVVVSKTEAIDINYPEDFLLAELVSNHNKEVF